MPTRIIINVKMLGRTYSSLTPEENALINQVLNPLDVSSNDLDKAPITRDTAGQAMRILAISRSPAAEDLLKQIVETNRKLKAPESPGRRLAERGIQIVVTPNWLLGGAPYVPSGEGGPATLPIDATLEDIAACQTWRLPPEMEALQTKDAPNRNVRVIILDTIPPEKRLKPRLPEFGGKLTVIWAAEKGIELPPATAPAPATIDDVFRADIVANNCHDPADNLKTEDYSDHGLFIAHTIHSIAPEAEIVLIQVLNDAGVGTMLGLTQALFIMRDLIEEAAQENKPTVVNLSVAFPSPSDAIMAGFDKFEAFIQKHLLSGIQR
jgi:hypothetical protein